jgi:DNA-binding response OmpR family regulator
MDSDETRPFMMIVEDDPGTRRSLGALFARRGWKVRSAATVAEAADLLHRGREPDVLILDLVLPDGSGAAILDRIRDAGLGTRVVVYTGGGDPTQLMRARKLGPDLLLIKPFDPDVLCNYCEGWARPTGR